MTDDERRMLEALAEGALGRRLDLERRHLDAAVLIADEFARRGAHDKAVRLFATIVLCDPHHRAAQVGLASGALEVGQPYVAMQAAAALIAAEPRNPLGYLLSGRSCLMAREWPEAEEDLRHAVEFGRAGGDPAAVAEAERLLSALPASAPAEAPTIAAGRPTDAPAIRFG